MYHLDSNGQFVQPEHHYVDDAVLVGSAALLTYGLWNERESKLQAMTPSEREVFRRRTPIRVAKRAGWAALWVGLLTLVFDLYANPGWLGTIILVGLPLALYVGAIVKERRFWANRKQAWDLWFRENGTFLAEVQAWWPTADEAEHLEFINLWGLAG